MDWEMTQQDDRLTGLYEKHNRAVRAYCLRRIGDNEVSDVVAEVFAVAWRRIDDIPDGEMALPWLYVVAGRIVADQRRSHNRRSRLAIKLSGVRPLVPAQPENQVVQRTEYDQVHTALDALREKDRAVLLLAAWEELSNHQIATILGCTTGAAAQRLHRAKKRLGRTYRALSRSGTPPSVADESERA
jgi:RNA polymerase sigma-70 factor (ECF subfamily)